jgi:hypothetical protein
MQASDIELRFIRILKDIAYQAGNFLAEEEVEFYMSNLSQYGYEPLVEVLQEFYEQQKAFDHMPSISEIERRLERGKDANKQLPER